MKALFTSRSPIDQTSVIAAATLISLAFWIFPEASLGAGLDSAALAPGQKNDALVFEIKNPETVTQTPQINQTSLSFDTVVKNDPLVQNLKTYLETRNSPLANYTESIVLLPNWKKDLAISYIESHMCVQQLYNNCSGIMTNKGIKSYSDFGQWAADMDKLISTRYQDRSFEQMNCVYVQPCSKNWVYASNKIYAELTELESKSNDQRMAMQTNTSVTFASVQAPELAELSVK